MAIAPYHYLCLSNNHLQSTEFTNSSLELATGPVSNSSPRPENNYWEHESLLMVGMRRGVPGSRLMGLGGLLDEQKEISQGQFSLVP